MLRENRHDGVCVGGGDTSYQALGQWVTAWPGKSCHPSTLAASSCGGSPGPCLPTPAPLEPALVAGEDPAGVRAPQPLDASSPFLEIEEDGASSKHFAPPWPLAGAGGGPPGGGAGWGPLQRPRRGRGRTCWDLRVSAGGRLKTSAGASRTGKNTCRFAFF